MPLPRAPALPPPPALPTPAQPPRHAPPQTPTFGSLYARRLPLPPPGLQSPSLPPSQRSSPTRFIRRHAHFLIPRPPSAADKRYSLGVMRIALAMALCLPLAALAEEPQTPNAQTSPQSLSPAMTAYISSVTQSIKRHLMYRPGEEGKSCQVVVTQSESGEVQAVEFKRCASKEIAWSVETAVLKASPLPLPTDPSLFNSKLVITFVAPERL